MKKILFFILLANFFSAQNPDLLNTNWQITKIITASGSNILPPQMPYQQNTTFSTTYPDFNSSFFNTVSGNLTYSGQNNFTVNSRTCTLADYLADNGEVNQFFGFICNFYSASGSFYYNIQSNGTQKTLIIGNSLFEEIHFFYANLDTKEGAISQIVLAPNPVQDILKIKNTILIKSYKIFDQSGKLIVEKRNLNEKIVNINIQNYQKGLYYIHLNDDKAISFIKK